MYFRKLKYILVAAASLALGQATQPRQASLPAGSATIEQTKGEVIIQSPQGAKVTAQTGVLLEADTHIETRKGSLTLTLQDGSQVLIEPHSMVRLTSPQQNRGRYIEQYLGKILAKVQKRLGVTPSFRMGTPTAVISVRGTEFEVSVNSRKKTTVDVYEGLVEVQSIGNLGSPVLVHPNFTTNVEPDEPPEQPKPVEHGPSAGGPSGERKNEHSAWPGLGVGAGIAGSHSDAPDSGDASKPTQTKKQEPTDD